MAELTLRRRPRYTVRRPTRARAGVPRIPAPTLAGEGEVGTVVKRQIKQQQDARWEEAKLAVVRLSETNPVGAAQFWLDFLNRELREHADLYPEGSADRASLQGEIVLAQQAIGTAQRTMSGAELEAQLATGGLSDEEQIRLLKQKLASLPVGSEEYYNTLTQLRELEAAAAERRQKAGEKASVQAYNDLVDRIGNDMQDLEAAYQGGKISGAEYDKRMISLYKEYFAAAKKQGETVSDADKTAYNDLKSRAKIDPKLVYDYYDINPSTGAYERVRTTKHRLMEEGKGVIELQDEDPTTGKLTPFPVAVSTKKDTTGAITDIGIINPTTGEWGSTLTDWKGEDVTLSTLFKDDPAGVYMRTAPVYDTEPTTGKKTFRGYAFAAPGRPGGIPMVDEPGGMEANQAKIGAFWALEGKTWKSLPTTPAEALTESRTISEAPIRYEPIPREAERYEPWVPDPIAETGRVAGGAATPVTPRGIEIGGRTFYSADEAIAFYKKKAATDLAKYRARPTKALVKAERTVLPSLAQTLAKSRATRKKLDIKIGKSGYVEGVAPGAKPSWYKPPKKKDIWGGIKQTFQSITSGIKGLLGW